MNVKAVWSVLLYDLLFFNLSSFRRFGMSSSGRKITFLLFEKSQPLQCMVIINVIYKS